MSRRSVLRVVGLTVVLGVAAAGVSVAIAAGTHHALKYSKQSSVVRWSAERPRSAQVAASGPYRFFVKTGRLGGGGRFGSQTLSCPGSNPHAIGGFFDSNSNFVFLATTRPGKRGDQWIEGVTNAGKSTANVLLGVVCAR